MTEKSNRAFGWKIRLCQRVCFDVPFVALIVYLFFLDLPTYVPALLGVVFLFTFGIAGTIIEQKMLSSFRCPQCRTRISEWRCRKDNVYYLCSKCSVLWDIKYKIDAGNTNSMR